VKPGSCDIDVGQVEIANGSAAADSAEQAAVLGGRRDLQVGDAEILALEQPGEVRNWRKIRN
jgi:hypothetical protein